MSDKDEIGTLDQVMVRVLIELQQTDDRIRDMGERRTARPAYLAERRAELAEREKEAESTKSLAQETQRRIDALGVEAQSLADDAVKLEGQLYSLKSNTEFEAMKVQIAHKVKEKAKLEDSQLELMVSIDDLQDAAKAADERRQDAAGKVAKAEESVAAELKELESETAVVRQRREEIAQSLPEELRELFEYTAGRREGKAIAIVEDGFCRGCDLRIMPQIVGNLRADLLKQCPHCDRILYLLKSF